MPTLRLQIAPLQNPERYAALGAALTRITAQVLHKRPEVTVVTIDDLPAARYLVGGRAAEQPLACLEISVTAGTNTADEKRQFIQQAHAELHRQLSAGATLLHEASYVIVRELPASDWGYGGHTQAHRQAQRALNQAAPLSEGKTHAIAAGAQVRANLKPS
jgi:4-oxalocrotonate tautomerase